MKPKLTIDPVAIDAFEDSYRLLGKRTRDIPRLATFRVEAIRRFHRLGEFNLAIAVFNALLATGPHHPLQWLAWLAIPVNMGAVAYAETRAKILSRQLNRRAAEQMLRDLMEIHG